MTLNASILHDKICGAGKAWKRLTKLLIRKSMIQNWSYEIDDARWCTMIPYRDDPIPRWYHTAEAVTPVDTQWYVSSISRAIYRDLVVKSLLWWFTILMAANEPVLFFGNPENDGTDGSTWCVTIIEWLWWFDNLIVTNEPVFFFGNPENDGTDGLTWCVTTNE